MDGWLGLDLQVQLLLLEHRLVQPYYIVDRLELRPGAVAERRAMLSIREHLGALYPQAVGRLAPTIECPLADVAADERLTTYYEQCLTHGFIGGQYEWLARFCVQHGIDDMELAIHRDDKARDLLADLIDPSRTRLDPRFAGDGRYELFKYFRFPVFDRSKQMMRTAAHEAGFDELMRLTWFCHRPRHDQPCGTCNPCIYTIEEGLGDRVPLAGRIRYQLRVLSRVRSALARHAALYLSVRTLYRRLRSKGHGA